PASGLGGDARAVAALQQRRFRDQVRIAAAGVPFYRDLIRQLDVDPAMATPAQIPTTAKAALRDHPEDFINAASLPVMRVTTTGTTGTPTVVHYSRREWRAIGALAGLSTIGSGLLRPDDIVHIGITPRAVLPNSAVISGCSAAGAVVHVAGMVD